MKLSSIGSKLGAPAAVLVITASGLLGGIGTASADGPQAGGTSLTPVTRNVSPTSISAPGGRVLKPVTPVRVMLVKALATGQGVSQAKCDALARDINTTLGQKQEAANNQNQYLAEEFDLVAEAQIDHAMDAGCAILY
jgi:hypothetical protein